MKKPILTICVMILTIIVIANNVWDENVFYDNIENNFAEQPAVNVQPSDTLTVTIGTDDTYNAYLPYTYWYYNSLSEVIYMSEEITEQGVTAGLLTEIIYFYTGNSALPEQNIVVWVGETDLTSPPEEWISAGELTLVYEGTMNIPLFDGELHLPFDEPYPYTGENLVIMVQRPWHYQYGGNLFFYYTETPDYPNRAIYKYSDIFEFNPFDPPQGSYYLSCVPNTALIFTTENNGYTDNTVDNPNSEIAHISNNYPNPFNPETTISFNLTAEDAENAELVIYNIKGQKVKQLLSNSASKLSAGQHSVTWNGKDDNGKSVSSGIYLYKLRAGDFQKVRKMILLK